jgi:hypothetical protein
LFPALAGLLQAHGFAERNRQLEVKVNRNEYGAATFSVFLLTSLTAEHGFYLSNPAFGNNTAEDWLDFVNECIVQQVRVAGCVMCVSNTSVRAAPGAR